jgi:hypothetical protein
MNFLRKITDFTTPFGGLSFSWNEGKENKLEYFLIGCCIGNRIALIPVDDSVNVGLQELFSLLKQNNTFKDVYVSFNDLLPRMLGARKKTKSENQKLFDEYIGLFDELLFTAKSNAKGNESFYLNFGRIIYAAPTMALVSDEVPVSYVNALKALSEDTNIPPTVNKLIIQLINALEASNKEAMDKANEIAQVIYLIL